MFIRHRQPARFSGKLPCMTSQTLASTLAGFLSGSNNAVVIEDGAVVFDLGQAKYSVSGESEYFACPRSNTTAPSSMTTALLLPERNPASVLASVCEVMQGSFPEKRAGCL